MTKKALEFIDKEISSRAGQIQFCGRTGYHRGDLEAQIDTLTEIRSLIENFGGTEEEVWGKKEYDFSGGKRGPIESSGKRTVSKEGALAWWKGIHKMGIKSGGNQFLGYLRSLGISIEEPKGGVEVKCDDCPWMEWDNDEEAHICGKLKNINETLLVTADFLHPSCPLPDWPRVSMKILEEIIALDDREKLWTELRSKGIEIEE